MPNIFHGFLQTHSGESTICPQIEYDQRLSPAVQKVCLVLQQVFPVQTIFATVQKAPQIVHGEVVFAVVHKVFLVAP